MASPVKNALHVSNIIATACGLHICEIHGETFNDAWLSEEVSQGRMHKNRGGVHKLIFWYI